MIVLQANSLVSVEEYRVYAELPDTAQGRTQASGSIIHLNAAIDYMEQYVDKTFLSGSIQQEEYTGKGYNETYDLSDNEYTTKQRPITNNPLLEYWNGTTWVKSTLVFDCDFDEGIITLKPNYYFDYNVLYRWTYAYGYSINSVPSNLKIAQLIMTKCFKMLATHDGTVSTSHEGLTKTYSLTNIPKFAISILDQYR